MAIWVLIGVMQSLLLGSVGGKEYYRNKQKQLHDFFKEETGVGHHRCAHNAHVPELRRYRDDAADH